MLAVKRQTSFQCNELLGHPLGPERGLGDEQFLKPRGALPVDAKIFPYQLLGLELLSRVDALKLEVFMQVDPRVNVLTGLVPKLFDVRPLQKVAQLLEETFRIVG